MVHGCDESDLAHRRCAQWADLWRDQTGVEPPWLICGGQGYCTVFVTSATQQGNFGGIPAADAICNDLAEQEGLQGVGNYMAWVSDDDESPRTRFNQAAGQYRLADGTTVVADDWDDLTDGTLQHAIDMLEDGTELTSPAAVWTSTGPDGTGRFPHCDEWTNTVDRAGIIGMTAESNSDWTRRAVAGAVQCDRSDPRLYCFQQQ